MKGFKSCKYITCVNYPSLDFNKYYNIEYCETVKRGIIMAIEYWLPVEKIHSCSPQNQNVCAPPTSDI